MFKIIDQSNIDVEHICCSLNEKKGEKTTSLKKAWMKKQFDNGLVFKRLDERGKVFIEYMPSEVAFAPIVAENYMYINCLWVSGKYKNQGHGQALLDSCIEDAKRLNKDGIVVLSSKKKRHFMSDPDHLKHYGFVVADTAAPDFELLYFPLKKTKKPFFKLGQLEADHILYYSHQCPHTEKYAQLVQKLASDHGINLILKRFDNHQDAQTSPSPFTTYALYLDQNFVTTEVLTEKKFVQILKKHMLI